MIGWRAHLREVAVVTAVAIPVAIVYTAFVALTTSGSLEGKDPNTLPMLPLYIIGRWYVSHRWDVPYPWERNWTGRDEGGGS